MNHVLDLLLLVSNTRKLPPKLKCWFVYCSIIKKILSNKRCSYFFTKTQYHSIRKVYMIKRETRKYLIHMYLPLSSGRQVHGSMLGIRRWRMTKIFFNRVSSRLEISRLKTTIIPTKTSPKNKTKHH